MFGRLPWLAFERRIRAFFFFVFFDIVPTRYRQTRLITPFSPFATLLDRQNTQPRLHWF